MRGIVVWDLVDVIVLDSHQDIEHELDPKRFIIKKSESLFEREEKKERERERERKIEREKRGVEERDMAFTLNSSHRRSAAPRPCS